jgi:hypothetical protein
VRTHVHLYLNGRSQEAACQQPQAQLPLVGERPQIEGIPHLGGWHEQVADREVGLEAVPHKSRTPIHQQAQLQVRSALVHL